MQPLPVLDRTTTRELLKKLRTLRNHLKSQWAGQEMEPLGSPVDWILASLIAREPVLLLGPPGVAKSEMAITIFRLLGLQESDGLQQARSLPPQPPSKSPQDMAKWWLDRNQQEKEKQKLFHYLLGRFTQPEELFGPVEIDLLKQGLLVRVNFGLMTGPGVRAAFLDEVFKASSSILNTLLTLLQERRYFNWGGMVPSDLQLFIAASNELPGGFSNVASGGSSLEDFTTLHAFLDRFPVRLEIPCPSPGDADHGKAYHDAFTKAMEREGIRMGLLAGSMAAPSGMPTLDDILALGQLVAPAEKRYTPFNESVLKKFKESFLNAAAALEKDKTDLSHGRITWTLSPRKLKAVYKVCLAHALVRDEGFASGNMEYVALAAKPDLLGLAAMWDSMGSKGDLEDRVVNVI